MATFILIHGAGDVGWYWHLAASELRARGHETVAPDLPCDDDSAGLSEYRDTVLDATGDRSDLVVVAQSAGAFTAPLLCDVAPVELLVLVAGLIPAPGAAARDWWVNTGYEPLRGEWSGDDVATFYHDVPSELAAEALARGRVQSDSRPTSRGRSQPGQTCQPASCCAATIVCCPRSSCVVSSASALASLLTRSTEGIASR